MSHTRTKSPVQQQNTFRLSPLALACATALFATASWAQQAPAEKPVDPKEATATAAKDAAGKPIVKTSAERAGGEATAANKPATLEGIVVTGLRTSIESSIAAKRSSDSIVEVVTAEDIGKLPDVSIAESLARLPGLAGQRVDGRVQEIQIRGLSGNFAVVLLNGREQVSTGDNRSVQYDQYPSELITRATVYKTPDATLASLGIAGVVNMESIRPLDYKGQQVAFNVRGEKNSNGVQMPGIKDTGNRISASYVNQFANNTVGVALGFAHLDSPLQSQLYNNFGYSFSPGNQQYLGVSGLTVNPAAPTLLTVGYEVGPQSSSQKRDGAMGVLEFRPNQNFRSTLDFYYSTFKTREKNSLFQALGFGRFDGVLSNLTQANGILTSGTYDTSRRLTDFNFNPNTIGNINNLALRSQINDRDDKLSAFGWNNQWNLGQWKAIGDFSVSKATRDDVQLESYARIISPQTINFVFPADGQGFPTLGLGRSYNDPATLRLVDQFVALVKEQRPVITDDLKSARFEAKRGLDGFFSNLDVGLNFSKRDKTRDWNEIYYGNPDRTTTFAVTPDLVLGSAPANFVGIPGLLVYDIRAVAGRYATPRAFVDNETFGKRWEVHEKLSTAFAKLSFDSTLGSIPIRGNLGLQYVHADQNSDGFDQASAGRVGNVDAPLIARPVNRGTSYHNFLPSLNVIAELTSDTYMRFGAARTVARPRMDQMTAYNRASLSRVTNQNNDVTQSVWSGSGGNPLLKPWVADGLDLSIEKYFAKGSYVSFAGFSKKLVNYIYNQTTQIDYSAYPNNTPFTPLTNIGNFTRPENGQGGNVEGIELTATLEGKLFTPMLDGFGISASGSDTHSKINTRRNGINSTTSLEGLSGRVTNLTVYYEKSGLSARVSQRKRSPFTAETIGLFGNRSYELTLADDVIDYQLGYTFEAGALKGLGILFQVNNATDAATRTYVVSNNTERPQRYNTYGRQMLLGVSYKF